MERNRLQGLPTTNQAFEQLLMHSQVQMVLEYFQYPSTWVEQELLALPWGQVDSLPLPGQVVAQLE